MSGIWKAAVVLVALAAIGCASGEAAQVTTPPTEADSPEERVRRFTETSATEARNTPLVQPQEDLLKQIGNLEAQLQELRWTEQDAIAVVQFKLRDHLQNSSDPLLKTLITVRDRLQNGSDTLLRTMSIAQRFRRAIGLRALEQGEWSAVHEPIAFRWRVESALPWDGTQFLQIGFYAYEKTGLVEGIPTPQQSFGTVEDRLRRLRESKLMEEGAAPATK